MAIEDVVYPPWMAQIQSKQEVLDNYFNDLDYKDHPFLSNPHTRKLLRTNMEQVCTKRKVLFCLDVEAWERNTEMVTEIGIAVYDPRLQLNAILPVIKTVHLIIKENEHRRNGRYVPEHSLNFNGGTTYVLPRKLAILLIESIFDQYALLFSNNECCLVGHDIGGDLKWLSHLGLTIRGQYSVLDTQTVFACSHGKQGASLKNALRAVNQPYAFLHNAGNDAYYTLLLALSLCDPVSRVLNEVDNHELQLNRPKMSKNLKPNVSLRARTMNAEILEEIFGIKSATS